MRRTSRPGRSLEKLVASIERVLGKAGNIQIDSPAFLPDRVTGEQREHDVLLTIRTSHHKSLIAIECRDRSRKVTVNEVEGFHAKCADTGVGQGIIVSPQGFTRNATAKARHLGLRTLQLSEVERFNWLAAAGINIFTRHIKSIGWLFEPDVLLDPLPPIYTILTDDGQPIQPEALRLAAQAEFQKIAHLDTPPPFGKNVIIFPSPGLSMCDEGTQEKYRIGRAILEVEYEVREDFSPFRLVSYAESASGAAVADAAIADTKLGVGKGQVMVVYKENEGGRVVFIPESRDEIYPFIVGCNI
jgi:hypothetical protein